MVDTRHAVGCRALRGGVPCTCWITESQPRVQPDDLGPGKTPLWIAISRLREQSARPHLQTHVVVQAVDVEQVLDALVEAEKCMPWHHADGGEA